MKNMKPLFPVLALFFLFSCTSSSKGVSDAGRAMLDKTYDYDAIPPAFNKTNVQVLLVSTDFTRKKFREELATIVKETYKGASEMLYSKHDDDLDNLAEIDKLYPDINKYRFIFYEGSQKEIRHSIGTYDDAYGVLNVQYSIYDRLEKKTYNRFFRKNRNWKVTAAYALEKLNAKL